MVSGQKLAISVDEAARILGISRNLAYEAVRRGDIPSIRVGQKRILIPVRALERLLDGEKIVK